ncbi:hypothetical protein D9M69_718520 [compost metagenome]
MRSTCAQASAKASTGKVLGEGRPPAKLMMPGFSVTLRISRITEGFMRSARRARVQGLAMGRSLGFMCISGRSVVQSINNEKGGALWLGAHAGIFWCTGIFLPA